MSNIRQLIKLARAEAMTDAAITWDNSNHSDLAELANECWHESECAREITPARARETCRVEYIKQFRAWPKQIGGVE